MKSSNLTSIILIGGSTVLSGIVNYLYHPLMLRYMSLEEFGAFASMNAIVNILSVLTVGFSLFLSKEYSRSLRDMGKLKYINTQTTRILGGLGIGLFLVYILFVPMIAGFLRVGELAAVAMTGVTIILAFLAVSQTALLRSMRAFAYLGFNQVAPPIVKLVAGFVFVSLGWGISGAVGGLLVAGGVSLILSLGYIWYRFRRVESTGIARDMVDDIRQSAQEIGQFLLVSVFFTFLMNVDILLAKNIFSHEVAGAYAGVSVLSKFLIFLLLSVETVYYGQVMEHERGAVPYAYLRNPMILIILGTIVAVVVSSIAGEWILSVLKPGLESYSDILTRSLIFSGLLAGVSYMSKILIGWGVYLVNWILGILGVFLLLGVYTIGIGSLQAFVTVFVLIGAVAFLIVGVLFVAQARQHIAPHR